MAVPIPETLEKAKEMLLEYNNKLEEAQKQIETLTTQNGEKDNTINDLRDLNQKYFLRLAQGTEPEEPEENKPTETLEEYAIRKLGGIIK